MQVTVICRKNQARSIFAEYVISSQFPDIEVKSAGTHVELGDLPALQVSKIASEWGVNCEGTTTTKIGGQSLDVKDPASSASQLFGVSTGGLRLGFVF